jgi:hypothetical protein
MEQITIGQIFSIFAVLAGAIGSIGIVVGAIVKFWKWVNKKEMNPILEEIKKVNKNVDNVRDDMTKKMDEKIDSLEINQCKDAIVDFISDVKSGKNVSSKEERAYEAYDKYTNVYHQNSYIHKLWEENINKDNTKE